MVSPSLPLFPLRDPVILFSILKSGSGIPHSLVYTKRGRTVSSPHGERKIGFKHIPLQTGRSQAFFLPPKKLCRNVNIALAPHQWGEGGGEGLNYKIFKILFLL
jgi:hypothetical protein